MEDAGLATLRAAATSGDPEALYRLGNALVLQREMEEACAHHARAAAAGHALSQIEYARMLLYGIGTEPAAEQAVHWLLRAEASGHAVAAYLLALIAIGGVALPRDEAINHRLQAAVRAGFPPAMRAAAIHFGRKSQPEDQRLCLRLLHDAATRGDSVCAALLAERLARGEGLPPDPGAAQGLRAAGASILPEIASPLPWQASGQARTLELREALLPPPLETRSERPRIAVVDGLLSVDECRLLVAAAQPILGKSMVNDPETGENVANPMRTSSEAGFNPVTEDLALRVVQLRLAAAAGVDLPNAEHLIVLRYAPGQEYRPHRDYIAPRALEHDRPETGNRLRTICVYLNAPEAGGETEFPIAGIRVAPKPGRAVIFDNMAFDSLHPDGRPDPESLHAGLPVVRGEKWLATLWLRQRRYRGF
ncbi:MAG: 2OG-Fe(II) oxygenase [Thermomonas sp.]